ncbi:transposase, partial [Methylobacterium sp. J-078]|uniref:transposase n=1 Tax=Methylobacterium sp. J-078 TaxID=2836657 RepID=UPI001FB8EFBD
KHVHVILDNYGSNKPPRVRAWLPRHPRWSFHFTPTSASWINAVEGFFSALPRRRFQRGTCAGVVDPQVAIKRYSADQNRTPKPFTCTKRASAIFDALSRAPEPSV